MKQLAITKKNPRYLKKNVNLPIYVLTNFSGPKFKNPGQHPQMYIMYHLLKAAGPPLPQNIMAFSNQIDFETDP